ncbi:MAG: sulfotransferase domain-containing protein [Thermoleophilaceae bacterium]
MASKHTLDFIVIGAFKCGTSPLFEYLRGHPQIYMPAGKEVPYFDHDDTNRVWMGGWSAYLDDLFADAERDALWGTATPQYMAGSVATSVAGTGIDPELIIPSRIRSAAPEAKLVAILRDPVERARSHHRMMRLLRVEERSFDQAVLELLEPHALRQARRAPVPTNCYIVFGEYGRILSGYRRCFPGEQLLVVFTEHMEQSPGALLQTVLEFLEVDPTYAPANLGKRYATGATRRRITWLDPARLQRRAARNTGMRHAWRALPENVRRFVLKRDRELRHRLFLWNRVVDEDTDPEPLPATVTALREHYEDDGRMLRELLGQGLPWDAESGPAGAREAPPQRRVDPQPLVDE